MATATIYLDNDQYAEEKVPRITSETIDEDLAELMSVAIQWSNAQSNALALSFSSMMSAMCSSRKPLCTWLQRHLGLRGVRFERFTGGKDLSSKPLPTKPVPTSESFRNAFAVARALWEAGGRHGEIAARHYMAAYAVCPEYHLADFLSLRIDRRAWCLDLASHLASEVPAERDAWQRYAEMATAIPVLEFNTDAPEGRDLLNIDREVEAFARLIVARTTATPLSIGVFGAWGSGKSFFMQRVHARVAQLAAKAQKQGRDSAYHGQVAQISFNAWHYSEGKLVACLVDHIFKNLRFTEDEDDATLRARGAELLVQIDRAKQDLAGREQSLGEATETVVAAQQKLAEIEARFPVEVARKKREIEAAEAAQVTAEAELASATKAKDAEIEAARERAPVQVGFALFRSQIKDPKLAAAAQQVTDLIDEAKSVGTRWVPILLGVLALGIGLLATQLLGSEVWARVTSVAAAIGSFAAIAMTWLKKLDGIAKKGEEYQTKIKDYTDAATGRIEKAHEADLANLSAAVAARQAAIEKLAMELEALTTAAGTTKAEIDKLDEERTKALVERDSAAASLAVRTEQLASLSTGTLLGEFLVDRSSTDSYASLLTILSRVRNDFARLSKLMDRATREYYDTAQQKPPPPVSRIVLYIDDLDRCPEDKVIEVLRVVHLLLAFPLFVCVVAVDPRWVTQCLSGAAGLIEPPLPGAAVSPHYGRDAGLGDRATPADYLEKIFQIPLWLRPVPEAQRAEIVRTLLDPSGSRSNAHHEVPVLTLLDTATPNASAARTPMLEGVKLHQRKDPGEGGAGSSNRKATDLVIDAVELRYLDEIAKLLGGNPRGLKRFVNTYRLVKSALSDVELEVFRSRMRVLGESRGEVRYLPYRLCMTQLAVLCTQRERALQMVQLADAASETDTFSSYLQRLESVDSELAVRLRAALLGERKEIEAVSLETFKLWLERTRRYSFYV